jgi:hypothetical protein
MAATKFGILVSTANAIIGGHLYPDSDADLNAYVPAPGQTLVQCSRGPYASSAAWQAAINAAVLAALGKAPGDPTCAVVDNTNTVVNLVMADAALASAPSGMTLVQCYAPIPMGAAYDPGTGLFTAPSYTLLAAPSKGRPTDTVVPAAVIPKV